MEIIFIYITFIVRQLLKNHQTSKSSLLFLIYLTCCC